MAARWLGSARDCLVTCCDQLDDTNTQARSQTCQRQQSEAHRHTWGRRCWPVRASSLAAPAWTDADVGFHALSGPRHSAELRGVTKGALGPPCPTVHALTQALRAWENFRLLVTFASVRAVRARAGVQARLAQPQPYLAPGLARWQLEGLGLTRLRYVSMQRVRAEQSQGRPLCCLALLTLCLHVLRPAACQTAEHVAPLRFKNGKFKVVQLTDMHLGESEASNAATYEVRSMHALGSV